MVVSAADIKVFELELEFELTPKRSDIYSLPPQHPPFCFFLEHDSRVVSKIGS